jgi:hypothetical protein
MLRLCSDSAQALLRLCSGSAQVKAAVAHVCRLKRNQRKGKLILSLRELCLLQQTILSCTFWGGLYIESCFLVHEGCAWLLAFCIVIHSPTVTKWCKRTIANWNFYESNIQTVVAKNLQVMQPSWINSASLVNHFYIISRTVLRWTGDKKTFVAAIFLKAISELPFDD